MQINVLKIKNCPVTRLQFFGAKTMLMGEKKRKKKTLS